MGDWPLLGDGQRYESVGMDMGASLPLLVSPNASAHVKGAYTQLVASTAFNATGLWVWLHSGTVNTRWLVDLAIGASGQEDVIIPNMQFSAGATTDAAGALSAYFPIAIGVGSRLAARAQSADAGGVNTRVGLLLMGQGFLPSQPVSIVDTYGAQPGSTITNSIDAGASANTKGAYTEISASTVRPIRYLVLTASYRQRTTTANPHFLVDISVGAAGSEHVLIPNLALTVRPTLDEIWPRYIGTFPVSIPIGTRLAARAQCSIATATERTFDLGVHAVS